MSNTITKATLAASLMDVLPCKPTLAKNAIEDLVSTIQGALFQRDSLRIMGVTRLDVNLKRPRIGRNPKTGVEHPISERYAVTAVSSSGQREPKQSVVGKGSIIQTLTEFGYTGTEATAIVETFFTAVRSVQTVGNVIRIRGLGKFYPRVYKAGTLRNPSTGESVQVGARAKVAFKCSKRLLAAIDTEWL